MFGPMMALPAIGATAGAGGSAGFGMFSQPMGAGMSSSSPFLQGMGFGGDTPTLFGIPQPGNPFAILMQQKAPGGFMGEFMKKGFAPAALGKLIG